MATFYIVNESSEDTLETTDDLQDAIQLATEAAKQAQVGELVSILENGGKAVRQFMNMPNGMVSEQTITNQSNI